MKLKSEVFNLALISISIVILITYLVCVDGIKNIVGVFIRCNPFWIIFGVFAMLLYWVIEVTILKSGLAMFNEKLSFKECFKNCVIGQFFCNITPSSTGGQPFQIIHLKSCGLSYGITTSVLLIKFICFQLSLMLVSSVVFIIKFKEYCSLKKSFVVLMVVGYVVNLMVAIFLIVICLNGKFLLKVLTKIVNFFGKIKLVKNPEKKIETLEREVLTFCNCFEFAAQNVKKVFKLIILSVLQILTFYSINTIIALAFEKRVNLISMLNMIAGAACVQVSSTFVPLPGSIGCAEFSYFVVFGEFFKACERGAGVLLWRLYTFYTPTIFGLIMSRNLFSKLKKAD